ncbi:P63C domain-containing protein (plasmid) [Candidatus Trichorickettsia mobilis]|uniref:P63C domain-containing protein n=1 Tax=Candidatus Trichorickettsia mobilis TaxID=1346319 RepID=A0ABZ0UTW6_9RICK|nr:P63C domain-containing protein [Candidatus Trichorickettsia mobilis]WPY01488.1 P63C domain-containing protein [Candidatus Trichorickettsia mobilis]
MSKVVISKTKVVVMKKLHSTHEGTLRIMDKLLPCAVLEDGTRIISSSAVYAAFDRPRKGKIQDREDRTNLPTFIASNNLKPYVEQGLQEVTKLIEYLDKTKKPKKGYKAEILPALCDVYLQARKDNKLVKSQQKLADTSEMMVRSLAKVGVTALVDEATGYQNVRAKDALQALLDKYLIKEFAAWAKRFPPEFYNEVFRLRKWNINKINSSRRPCYAAQLTSDIVYDRLAPGILEELKHLKVDSEVKHVKLHQFLSPDLGHPALTQHLHTVTALMKACDNWDQFKVMIDKIIPKKNIEVIMGNA